MPFSDLFGTKRNYLTWKRKDCSVCRHQGGSNLIIRQFADCSLRVEGDKEFPSQISLQSYTPRRFFSESCKSNPSFDYNYSFPIDLAIWFRFSIDLAIWFRFTRFQKKSLCVIDVWWGRRSKKGSFFDLLPMITIHGFPKTQTQARFLASWR